MSAPSNESDSRSADAKAAAPESSTERADAQVIPVKSPENFSQAILDIVWRMPVGARIALAVMAIGVLALFAFWKTLPDSIRAEQFKRLAGNAGDTTTPSALDVTTGVTSQGAGLATDVSLPQALPQADADVKQLNEPGSRWKPLEMDTTALMAFYRDSDHTRLQADKLATPYIDRWLKVSGTIADVAGPPEDGPTVYLDVPADTDRASDTIVLRFPMLPPSSPVWILHKGQRVVAVGRLTTVTDRFIILSECELLDE